MRLKVSGDDMSRKALCIWMGGKFNLSPKLIPLFPPHQVYCEVFGGMANCLFQKPPSKIEIVNDINSDITNLFRVLRNDFDALLSFLRWTPFSRETYHAYIAELETETDPVKRAGKWYAVANQSFGGIWGGSFAVSKKRAKAPEFKERVAELHLFADRLRDVVIENYSFEKVIDLYDQPETFFYLDPPYVPETRSSASYAHEMTLDDHERLVDLLRNIQGKAMLSGYPNPLYESLGWQSKTFDVTCSAAGRTRASGLMGDGKVSETQKRTEIIWINYDADVQLNLFD